MYKIHYIIFLNGQFNLTHWNCPIRKELSDWIKKCPIGQIVFRLDNEFPNWTMSCENVKNWRHFAQWNCPIEQIMVHISNVFWMATILSRHEIGKNDNISNNWNCPIGKRTWTIISSPFTCTISLYILLSAKQMYTVDVLYVAFLISIQYAFVL